MAFRLIINNQSYTQEQLMQEGLLLPASEQQREVLTFVRQWLHGQQEFFVHTSGSTGTPKAINISRQRMQASARLTLEAIDILPGEMAVLCIHADFIGGKMMLVRAIEGELPLLVLEPAANPFKTIPAEVQPHFAALVPLQLQAILEDPKSISLLNALKAVIVGGAAVSQSLEEALHQVQAPLYSTYGMTETVSHIALRRLNGPDKQDYFQVLPHIHIGTNERGCLTIDGPIVEEAVVTNDRVELLGDGKFRWLGRADNVINSGGVKVQAEQLESLAEGFLAEQGLSNRALAGGVPDKKLGNKVVLLLEGEPLNSALEERLKHYLVQQLPLYWAPKEIIYRASFVESTNGKIKRNETWNTL